MADKNRIFNDEARELVHNIRGSVGIINSSLELIEMEGLSENGEKMKDMISRQSYKILSEMELFTQLYAPKDFDSEKIKGYNIEKAIYFAAENSGTGIKIVKNDSVSTSEVNIPEPILKTVFATLLLRPSPFETKNSIYLKIKNGKMECSFKWPEKTRQLTRHKWLSPVLKPYNASFKINDTNAKLTFPLYNS